jgi:hypothetical protein
MNLLVELKEFTLAVRVAQAFKINVGYPLAYLIEFTRHDEEPRGDK